MKRTRTVTPPFGRAAAASVSPLICIILSLLILLCTVVATTTISSSSAAAAAQQLQLHPPAEEDNDDDNNYSTTDTAATKSQLRLQQTTKDYLALQSALDTKLQHIQNVRNKIHSQKKNLMPLHLPKQRDGDDPSSSTEIIMNVMYDNMDKISSKVVELLRRTETVLARLGAHNQLIISGKTKKVAVNETIDISQTEDENDNNTNTFLELETRLKNLMREEIERRDRYITSTMPSTTPFEEENNHDDDSSPSPHYITLTELTQLLSPNNILQHSESIIQNSLMELTTQLMETHVQTETMTWKRRTQQEIPTQYEREYSNATAEILLLYKQQQKRRRQQVQSNDGIYDTDGQCLTIPQSMGLVARALVEHHSHGGTTNMVDHASYENGGSVVYELTSWAYRPPPRNNDHHKDGMMIGGDGGGMSQRELYELAKQAMFDEHVENMYYQQQQHQQSMNNVQYSEYGQKQKKRESVLSKILWNPLSEMFEKMNLWKWYTTFPLGNALRPYLPEDWERLLDRLFSSHQVSSLSWSDYTPRGIVDVLIPDYVYHALGLENNAFFGSWFGRTASPEVAISDGYGKSGGGADIGGKSYTAMPLGHCYPLSMRPKDDPALSASSSLLNHRDDGGSPSFSSSLLIGPKYTVRLPYPIYIDAVTFEHRSFPLPPSKHNHNIGRSPASARGGESAPRWIRVVGFPPCSTKERDDKEVVDDECGVLGFDVAKPIDLGSFQYQRITESDDDIRLLDEEQEEKADETFPGVLERRRSVQTFAVRGGRLQPSSLLGNDSSEDTTEIDEEHYDSRDPRQCADDSKSCTATVEDDEDDKIDLAEESLPVGQCAPPKDVDSMPSCGVDATKKKKWSGGGKRQIVEAVSFIVEENWGNREYTCLYRVRVHGDAVSGHKK